MGVQNGVFRCRPMLGTDVSPCEYLHDSSGIQNKTKPDHGVNIVTEFVAFTYIFGLLKMSDETANFVPLICCPGNLFSWCAINF